MCSEPPAEVRHEVHLVRRGSPGVSAGEQFRPETLPMGAEDAFHVAPSETVHDRLLSAVLLRKEGSPNPPDYAEEIRLATLTTRISLKSSA